MLSILFPQVKFIYMSHSGHSYPPHTVLAVCDILATDMFSRFPLLSELFDDTLL